MINSSSLGRVGLRWKSAPSKVLWAAEGQGNASGRLPLSIFIRFINERGRNGVVVCSCWLFKKQKQNRRRNNTQLHRSDRAPPGLSAQICCRGKSNLQAGRSLEKSSRDRRLLRWESGHLEKGSLKVRERDHSAPEPLFILHDSVHFTESSSVPPNHNVHPQAQRFAANYSFFPKKGGAFSNTVKLTFLPHPKKKEGGGEKSRARLCNGGRRSSNLQPPLTSICMTSNPRMVVVGGCFSFGSHYGCNGGGKSETLLLMWWTVGGW